MQAKHHVILYTFLGLALVLAVFLAVDYGLQANRSAQALEDTYAAHVLETQEHLQAIGLKLGKTPIAADAYLQVELLTDISRQADGVVAGLAALPLSHVAMSDTIKFCNQLSEYTRMLALKVASGAQVGQSDLDRLGSLENQCALLLGQFVTARDAMLRESLRMSAQNDVFYADVQLADRPLEQVADADNGMDYPSMIYDGAFSDARHFGTPRALGERQITQEEAVRIAREFVGAQRVSNAVPAPESGGPLASFGVTLTLMDGVVLNADVTRQGGKLLWIVPEHASFEQKRSLEECTQAARTFLSQHGYGEMEANHYQVYDGLAVINFVAQQDGVLLYPDLVKVQMRMDTGEPVGLEANNYLMNHTQRKELSPVLTRHQALARVSPKLGATDARLCVIPYRDTEKLCYEAAGAYQGHDYRVYIDARTGETIEVLMMVDGADGPMAA